MTPARATLATPAHPRLAAHVQLHVIAGDHAILLSENGHRILSGRVYVELLPLLDGSRTVGELMRQLDRIVSAGEIAYALERATAAGLILDGPAATLHGTSQEAFWNALGHDRRSVVDRLARHAVCVRGLGDVPEQALRSALAAEGARLAGDADLLVVVTDDYLRRELAAINDSAIAAGRPWVLTRLTGHAAWIGPLFEPGITACWACLAQRLRANRQAERFLVDSRGRPGPFPIASAALDTTIEAAAALVATHVVMRLAGGWDAALAGRVVSFDLAGGQTRSHVLVRRPQCAACGARSAPGGTGARVRLRPAPAGATGGARGASADELLERFGHHVSPITGVVSELRPSADDEHGIGFTCTAVHDFPMIREDMAVLRQNLWGRSGGKGTTPSAARAGAIGEAIERYSCIWRGEEELALRASARELGDEAASLADCLGFSARQLAGRDAWNGTLDNPHHIVPTPLDSDLTISWTPLWSLTHERVRYLPTAYCYYGHPDMRHFFCLGDSNGCAAGSTLEEAVYHGLTELVERDAVAIWWYNRLRRPAVEVDRDEVPFHFVLRDRLRAEQRDLWLLELTCDTAIPAYAAISARCDHEVEDILLGFACDLDRATAMRRALTELAQSHPYVARRRAGGETIYGTRDRETLGWLGGATRARDQYLVPAPGAPPLHAADEAPWEHSDLRDDVAACVERLRTLGLEVLVLDQTRPDIGMPACRVVVPGLCHFWRRLGAARLYDVPVRAGWLERPTAEPDMNPYSIFF